MKATHPDAEIFPTMTPDEFERLADDIAANGLLEPITLLDSSILDGRHRQRACDERGVEARYVEWDATCGITSLEWVISKNLQRRQLNVSQRAALAVELESRLAEAARLRMAEGGKSAGRGRPAPEKGIPKSGDPIDADRRARRSDVIAGKAFGVAASSVTSLKVVRKKDPQLFERVKAGELGKEAARRVLGIGSSGGKKPSRRPKIKLRDALQPLHRYLKNWDEQRLLGMSPGEARRLLPIVQELDHMLFEVERALEEHSTVSRALR